MSIPYSDIHRDGLESTQYASMKVTGIVLRSSAQWRTWFSQIRASAKNNDVWEYLDPDNVHPPARPHRPRKPIPSDVQDDAEGPEDLTDINDAKLHRLLKHYDRSLLEYTTLNRAFDRVMTLIRTTLAPEHQSVVAEIEDPRVLLDNLRARFSPAEDERKIELYLQWGRLVKSSPKDIQVDSWLNEWENEFLTAIRTLDESFHGIWYEKIFRDITPVSFTNVVNAFRQKRAISQKKRPTGKAMGFATLDEQNEAGQKIAKAKSQPSQQTREKQERQGPRCVCDRFHFFSACPYLAKGARPSDWKPDGEVEKKIRQNMLKLTPNGRARVEKMLKQLHDDDPATAHFVDISQSSDIPYPPYAMFVRDCSEEDARVRRSTQEENAKKSGRAIPYSFFTENPENPFRDAWIVDSGSNRHITHNRALYDTFQSTAGSVKVGDTLTPFEGEGSIQIHGKHPVTGKGVPLDVHDVKYSPGFHANLLSLSIMRRKGYIWDTWRDVLVHQKTGHVIAKIHEENGLFVLTQNHVETPAAFNTVQRRSVAPAVSKATPERWHRRLAHMYDQRVEKLAEMADGIQLIAPSMETAESNPEHCETCQLTKAKRQISRRVQGTPFGPLGRVHFDLIQIREGFNSDKWITHFYIDGIRYHHLETHPSKNGCREAVKNFVALMTNWFKIPLRAFHYDNERAAGLTVIEYLEACGFVVEHSIVGTPEMNSFAERSGGVVITRMRSLIEDSKFPKELWPEAAHTAVYILNRSPTKLQDGKWIIPLQEFHRLSTNIRLPINLSNLRVYGCRAYVRIQGIPQSDKMHRRAEIGYLVGYKTTNIWRVWFPRTNSVRFVRDAVFDENLNYLDRPKEQPITVPPTSVVIEDDEDLDAEIEQAMRRLVNAADPVLPSPAEAAMDSSQQTVEETSIPHYQGSEQQKNPQEDQLQELSPSRLSEYSPVHSEPPIPVVLPTPSPSRQLTPDPTPQAARPRTPAYREAPVSPPYAPERASSMRGSSLVGPVPLQLHYRPIEETAPPPTSTVHASENRRTPAPSGVPGSFPNDSPIQQIRIYPQHRPRTEGVSEDNIVRGTRKRKAPVDPSFVSYFTYDDADDEEAVLAAFATGISASRPENHKVHRDELPPEPQNWREMLKHAYCEGWLTAAGLEVESIRARGTYQVKSRPQDRSIQILPLKWVFTYKFDSNGFLQKLKARICVRGDLQAISSEDKRAATLAARTARAIFALVAAFDLGTMQLDAVNAFLNSDLDEEVYTSMPEGFADCGNVWKLLKALYGLRKSPRLWQREATRVLVSLGFHVVPEDPCLLTRSGIIVFFYVDDIIIAYHRSKLQEAIQLRQQLERHWELRDMGEASWFLGIRILRDLKQHKLWLCQDSYIASMAARYQLTGGRKVTTPLPVDRLQPYTGEATQRQILEYQQKLGSALYATVITRPDAAKSASHLAEFLVNPGPEHIEAVNRFIRYLYTTRFHAIEFHPTHDLPALSFFSDASFGDHRDRKSSEGYLCKLFGGAVDWKASKQRTVTTSTTEAELLALSEAAKSALFWQRLLDAVNLKFDEDQKTIEIQCDNAQTVDLLVKDTPQLRTKLRHVDIHHCWLRQGVQSGAFRINWIPTRAMAADGLTKLLPAQNHIEFMRALGLVDIHHLIEGT